MKNLTSNIPPNQVRRRYDVTFVMNNSILKLKFSWNYYRMNCVRREHRVKMTEDISFGKWQLPIKVDAVTLLHYSLFIFVTILVHIFLWHLYTSRFLPCEVETLTVEATVDITAIYERAKETADY